MPKELTPTFTVISKACDGDETAISKILEFYDPYINQCFTKRRSGMPKSITDSLSFNTNLCAITRSSSTP